MLPYEKKNRILVFDVETTGLLPKMIAGESFIPITSYPHIIQFSFVVYNLVTQNIDRKCNFYIKIAPEIEISEKITEITGITREMCDLNGVSISLALEIFYDCYMLCDTVVAHNYSFDSTVLKAEIFRNSKNVSYCCRNLFNIIIDKEYNIESFCTMRYGTNICDIMKIKKDGKSYYKKWPTLLELYEFLFKETPNNLHNSMVDVLVCLRCYLKMRKQKEYNSKEFERLLTSALL